MNSWHLFFWLCIDLVLRKLMLVTIILGLKGLIPVRSEKHYKTNCGQKEEPTFLISRLLIRMRRMYVTSVHLDFLLRMNGKHRMQFDHSHLHLDHSKSDHTCFDHLSHEPCGKHSNGAKAFWPSIVVAYTLKPLVITSLNNILVYQQYSDSSFCGALHIAHMYCTLHLENKYDQYVNILKVRRKKRVSIAAVGDF